MAPESCCAVDSLDAEDPLPCRVVRQRPKAGLVGGSWTGGRARAEFRRAAAAAATAWHRQALDLFRRLGDRLGQAWALGGLGEVQLATADYRGASDNLTKALELHRELGQRHSEAVLLNSLGDLSSATSATDDARRRHSKALSIAREIGARVEEARALAGMGRSLLPSGRAEAAAYLRDALVIAQRTGSPEAQRIQDTLTEHGL